MNLGLFQPKKDECDICVGYKTKNISFEVYNNHIANKELARQEKDADKVMDGQIVFTMDLQSVLLSPKSNVSSLYYKMKLITHNFTIYNIKTKEGYCFIWHEGAGGLGANEFSGILTYFLLEKIIPNLPSDDKTIILYSDGCTYQNRNVILSNALLNISIQSNITIIQKMLEKGHTQMEADSMHSTIERKIKNRTINVPADYVSICQQARLNPRPYVVKYLAHNIFKKMDALKFYSSIRPGKKSGDPVVTQIRALKYQDGQIQFKFNFSDEWINLPQRINSSIQPLHFEILPNLYNEPLKISKEKYDHLQFLKKTIRLSFFL